MALWMKSRATVQAAVVEILDAREGGRQLAVPLVKKLPFGAGHRRRRRRIEGVVGLQEADEAPVWAPLVPLVAEPQGDERMEAAVVPRHRAGDAPLVELVAEVVAEQRHARANPHEPLAEVLEDGQRDHGVWGEVGDVEAKRRHHG